jgi:hypothetical protein
MGMTIHDSKWICFGPVFKDGKKSDDFDIDTGTDDDDDGCLMRNNDDFSQYPDWQDDPHTSYRIADCNFQSIK